MNNTKLLSKSDWLELFGSTFLLDLFYTYVLTPTSFIGFLLNILSFFIFQKNEFYTKPIFHYLRVYVINSSIICLLLSSYFVVSTYRFFEFTTASETYIYGVYFYLPIYSTFYFVNSFLDVYISMERLSIFIPSIRRIDRLSWKSACLTIFSTCLLINFPTFFIYNAGTYTVELNNLEMYSITTWIKTTFSKTTAGIAIVYAIYFMRDALIMGIEIFTNVLLVVLMKKHLSKKRNVIFNSDNPESHAVIKNITKADKNLIYMVIIMCLLSALEHISFLACTSYFLISQDLLAYTTCYASNQIISIKHSSNFFLFFLFNNMFRKAFKNVFKRTNSTSQQAGSNEN